MTNFKKWLRKEGGMMAKQNKDGIVWTDYTFNAWWGCEKVSPACINCYAEALSRRVGNDVWGNNKPRKFFGDNHWKEPLKWNEQALDNGERYRVFCGSMMDVFEDRRDLDEQRVRLFELIKESPNLDWQLLTKRVENILGIITALDYAPENVWYGTTVENQEAADERIPHLLKVPAKVHFLSCEPLLENIDLQLSGRNFGIESKNEFVDWVICGAESGHRAREMNLDWARSLRDQCQEAGVSFFMKQICKNGKKMQYEEFPEDLKIREFPIV